MFIDAHAHLDQYGDLLDAALLEIRQQQIFTISTAMDIPSYLRMMKIGEQCELVLPTFGVHPWNAPAYADRLSDLLPFIEQSPALGEIGLDFHWVKDSTCFPLQRRVFEFFLSAARDQEKIINLHTKGAEAEILRLLDRYKIQRAIVHWYSGPLDIFRELLARGYHFTIGVEVLSSPFIQALARETPLPQLLTETDNPGGAKWLTGRVGMPHLVNDVVQAIAAIRGISPDVVQQSIQANLLCLLGGDSHLAGTYRRMLLDRR